jgi:outer membrane protein assembly factor BamB
VLVADDIVYFAAGKSSYLDGGIHLYGLEPHSGRQVVATVLHARDADGSQRLDEQGVDGCLNDILSSDGTRIFMRHQVLDLAGLPRSERIAHLHGADGFLIWETTTRLQWTYAPLFTSPHQGAFYDLRMSRSVSRSGRILVQDGKVIGAAIAVHRQLGPGVYCRATVLWSGHAVVVCSTCCDRQHRLMRQRRKLSEPAPISATITSALRTTNWSGDTAGPLT